MACTYFVSDLHLTGERPAITRAFARFLADHRHAEALYILGDLFESWIGDDDPDPLAREVRDLLADFAGTGPRLCVMPGNRDFLLGESFATHSGATLLADPTLIDLYGRPTVLTHGDALCTADAAYQAFRREVRSEPWRAEFLRRPLGERRRIAAAARNMSRSALAGKTEDIVDVAPDAVTGLLREHDATQLIHGHTHRPAHHVEAAGERWVLGEWDETCLYLEASTTSIQLLKLHF